MLTLVEDGRRLLADGVTSVDEILRVTRDETRTNGAAAKEG